MTIQIIRFRVDVEEKKKAEKLRDGIAATLEDDDDAVLIASDVAGDDPLPEGVFPIGPEVKEKKGERGS